MFRHFDHFKILAADIRLLLVSGQIKEHAADYFNLLSLLDPKFDGLESYKMGSDFNDSISKLKRKLAQYVVFECKLGSSTFAEYWVPVQLSNLQLEQYCSMLLSNSILLCSNLKNDSADALRVLIISTRKSLGVSGRFGIGDILDDFVRQRFGIDYYVRIDRGCILSKKQAALDMFNAKGSRQFLLLIENHACLSSVKLSLVDIIILFDSDWDPLNDLRALQRISISSQCEQLKVLRLYSYCTIEEKVLILAKKGLALESNVQLINHTTSHSLLIWGASYLFKLPRGGDKNDCHGRSIMSKVEQHEGLYTKNMSLLGEREMKTTDKELSISIWTNLIKGRHPWWKFLPGSSQRVSKNDIDPINRKSRLKDDTKSVRKASKLTDNMDNSYQVHYSMAVPPVAYEGARAPEVDIVDSLEKTEVNDGQKSTRLQPKQDLSELCDVLQLSKEIKATTVRILEHVLKYYNVDCQEVSIMQAFQIALCWVAASSVKHKLDRKESLALAKLHLNFVCNEEEARYVYSKLWHIKMFASILENGRRIKDLVEGNMEKGFQSPHMSEPMESTSMEPAPEGSPDKAIPSTQHPIHGEILQTSERENASFDEHQNKALNASNDPHNSSLVKGLLEREGPVSSSAIMQSNCKSYEKVPQILVNEAVVWESPANIPTPLEQLSFVATDRATLKNAAVKQVRHCNRAVSQVYGESTPLEFIQTSSSLLEPRICLPHGDLVSSCQMSTSTLPEDDSSTMFMASGMNGYHGAEDNIYSLEDTVIAQPPCDLVEQFNPSAVHPMSHLPLQDSNDMPINRNNTSVTDWSSTTSPGAMNSYPIGDLYLTSEVSHCSDPL
ncbi:Helicase protein MOM1 [Quillaja saponaria]|uniref:Helicase protein MOM1 n=1 Tax=Quillaja saponaria TaxID=32244 RepID=A0AAD7Q044_QUISA|nr:Helicase protein MOM1 [Quillaja saponaria]